MCHAWSFVRGQGDGSIWTKSICEGEPVKRRASIDNETVGDAAHATYAS